MIKGKQKLFSAIASASMIVPSTVSAYANVAIVNEVKNANIMEVVKTDSLNVRSGAGTNYKKIGTLKRGQQVTVIGTSGNWAKFNFNGATGYASLSYLSKVQTNDNTATTKEMVVKADFLNVRKGSSIKYAVIGKVYEGETVQVVQELSNGWVKIKFNNGYGYVSNVKGAYLEGVSSSTPSNPSTPSTPDNSTPDSSTPDTSVDKYSATANINLRKTASWSGEIIEVVKKGAVLNVISINNGWAKVNHNGNTGYVPASHIVKVDSSTPSTPSTPSTAKKMVVKVDDLSVRTGSSTKYTKIGALNKGDEVTVVEELSNGWVKIEFNGGYGYVSNVKGAYLEESVNTNQEDADKVIAMIDAINSNVTLDDEDSIVNARKAYDALNKEAQALVTNLTKLTDAEAEFDKLFEIEAEKINNIMDKIDELEALVITFDNVEEGKQKINEINSLMADVYAPYVQNIGNLYKLEAKAKEIDAIELSITKAKRVSDIIDALNSPITLDDYEAVINAREAYDALTPEEQVLVTNVTKLTDAEAEIDRLEEIEADKYNEIISIIESFEETVTVDNVVQERAKLDNILDLISKMHPSEVQNLPLDVIEAKKQEIEAIEATIVNPITPDAVRVMIDGLNKAIDVNDAEAVKEAREAYESLTPEQQALVGDITYLTNAESEMESIRERISNVVDLIDALPINIELTHEQQVVDARTAFNALSVDEQNRVPFPQRGALESAEAKISQLKQEQSDAVIVQDLIERIEKLKGQTINIEEHEAEIKDIMAQYGKLEKIRQDEVTNYQDLLDANLELTHIYENIIHLEHLINQLPETIDTSHGATVEQAKKEFNDLGAKNQVGVKQELVEKLNDAIRQADALKEEILQTNVEVQEVVAEIGQLPAIEDIDIDDKVQVYGLVRRYAELPEDVKFAVDTTILEESFDKIETIMAEEVIDLINTLPSIDDLDLTHSSLLKEVRAKYDEISSRNNTKVTNINKLTELEVKMLELENVKPVIIEIVNKIKDLDHTITFDNYDETIIKVTEIEALLDTIELDEFDLITNLTKYEEVLTQISVLDRVSDITTGAQVVDMINALPEAVDITWGHGDKLTDIKNAYIKINDDEKQLIDSNSLSKLQDALTEYDRINNGINEVISAIHRIPAIEELTLDDEQLVIEARRLYESHDEKVTYYVNYMNGSHLLEAEAKIEELKKA